MSSPYIYPGTNTLINLTDIRDEEKLHHYERSRSHLRNMEMDLQPLAGNFDLEHLENIHRHLFQDVYPWAGQLRTVDIMKGGDWFCPVSQFERHADYAFGQLRQDNFLRGLAQEAFANRAAHHFQEINYGHYFREGNGRSTRAFFDHIAKRAGYELQWQWVPKEQFLDAVIQANDPKKIDDLVEVFRQITMPLKTFLQTF